tara:strand:+ start:391 stop:510 length:120 start_codon:yes stop_codon:yes gene_type:complete
MNILFIEKHLFSCFETFDIIFTTVEFKNLFYANCIYLLQ